MHGPLYQQHGGSSPRAPCLMTQVKCAFEVLLMHGEVVWERKKEEEVPHDTGRCLLITQQHAVSMNY